MRKNIKKTTIVETAYRLFKANGFNATGVDLIMREAAVSKRTLYKYFPTKSDLIVAVLAYYRASYQQHIDALLANEAESSRDKIRAIFADADSWFGDINFHGCLAVNAMAEFSGKDEAIETSCQHFKRWEISLMTELCRAMGADRAEQLAYKLFVLLEGMSAIALVNKGPCPVDMGSMADDIIEPHLTKTRHGL